MPHNPDMTLLPLDFNENGIIPLQFYFENENLIPQFLIKNPPGQSKYFAIILDDIDAPGGNQTHWVVYNIPSDQLSIGGDIEVGFTGKNSWTIQNYHGINPIRGRHRYRFRIFALRSEIQMSEGYVSSDLIDEILRLSISDAAVEAYADRTGSFSIA